MIPPILQQVLLLIESLLRAIEAEYCPPLRVLGVPLFRLPGARTRAAAQLRRLADEIAAVAATLPRAPRTPQQRAAASPPLFLRRRHQPARSPHRPTGRRTPVPRRTHHPALQHRLRPPQTKNPLPPTHPSTPISFRYHNECQSKWIVKAPP